MATEKIKKSDLFYEIGYYTKSRGFRVVARGFRSITEAEMMIELKQPHYKHLLLVH